MRRTLKHQMTRGRVLMTRARKKSAARERVARVRGPYPFHWVLLPVACPLRRAILIITRVARLFLRRRVPLGGFRDTNQDQRLAIFWGYPHKEAPLQSEPVHHRNAATPTACGRVPADVVRTWKWPWQKPKRRQSFRSLGSAKKGGRWGLPFLAPPIYFE